MEQTETLKSDEQKAKSDLSSKLFGWLKWIVLNGIGAYAIYIALFEYKIWAVNVVLFGAHLFAFYGIIMMVYIHQHKEEKNKLIAKKIVPLKLDYIYDMIIVFLFASQGWFYTAFLWFIQVLAEADVYSPDKPDK